MGLQIVWVGRGAWWVCVKSVKDVWGGGENGFGGVGMKVGRLLISQAFQRVIAPRC